MTYYVIRRTVIVFLQLLAVTCGTFVLLRLLDTAPELQRAPEFASAEELAEARRQLGLDVSIGEQLWRYLGDLLRGDFGTSWSSGNSVLQEVKVRLPISLQVTILSVGLAVILGVLIGRAAAQRVGSRFDRAVLNYTLFASAQPSFFWALVMIYVFFTKLRWAPAPIGLYSFDVTPPHPHTRFLLIDAVIDGNWRALDDMLSHMAIPVVLLALLLLGPIMKMTRQSVLGVMQSDYVLYARLSGLAPRRARWYMLRNALAPIVTLVGIFFAGTLGGVVLIEAIFAFPGLAFFSLQSTSRLDFPSVQACVIVLTLIALAVYLLMDIIYAVLDPRVAYGRAEK